MSRGAYLLNLGLVPYGEAFELQRYADFGAGAYDGMPSGGGPREILVHASDLDAARELVGSE